MLYDESVLDDINLLEEDSEGDDDLEGLGYDGTDDDEGDSDWDDDSDV